MREIGECCLGVLGIVWETKIDWVLLVTVSQKNYRLPDKTAEFETSSNTARKSDR